MKRGLYYLFSLQPRAKVRACTIKCTCFGHRVNDFPLVDISPLAVYLTRMQVFCGKYKTLYFSQCRHKKRHKHYQYAMLN